MNLIDFYNFQLGDYIYFKNDYYTDVYGNTLYYANIAYKIVGTNKTKKYEKLLIHSTVINQSLWLQLKWFDLIKYKRTTLIKKILQ